MITYKNKEKVIQKLGLKDSEETNSKFLFVMKNLPFLRQTAFSIAEAMIVLLIASLALAASTPLISKSIKGNAFEGLKWVGLEDKINKLENALEESNNINKSNSQTITELKNKINVLEKELDDIDTEDELPNGSVVFFHPSSSGYKKTSSSNPCPSGWSQLPQNYNNRFIRISDGRSGSRGFGSYQEDAFKEHVHITSWGENIEMYNYNYSTGWNSSYPWGYYWPSGVTSISQLKYVGTKAGFDYDNAWSFTSPPALRVSRGNSSNAYTAKILTGTDYNETRPKNVALLACVKGNMPDNYKPVSNTIKNEVTGMNK